MDTHITDADLGHAGVGLASPIGLPGEDAPGPFVARERLGAPSSSQAAGPGEASTPDPATRIRRARRGALLAGMATVVLFGVGGAGLYAFRDDIRSGNLIHRVTAMVSHSANTPQSAPMEAGVTAHPVAAAAPAKPVQPSVNAHAIPAAPVDSAATLARDFAALQSFSKPAVVAPTPPEGSVTLASPIPPAATAAVSVKPSLVVIPPPGIPAESQTSTPAQQEAGIVRPAVLSEPSGAMSAALSAAVAPAPASPVAPPAINVPVAMAAPAAPAPAPVVPPREPAITAAELKAGPMTSAQQVEVVGLVKSLGAQLRDTRIEVAELHQIVAQLSDKVETRTTDFENRLGLAEAAAIVQSSARAGAAPPPSDAPPPSPPMPPMSPTTQPLRVASARNIVPLPVAPASLPERRTVKDYVVKGASPGLAVLAALNPLAGSSSVIEVGVGDPVPGVGRIKRVYQRGTTWIVETENGSIQQ